MIQSLKGPLSLFICIYFSQLSFITAQQANSAVIFEIETRQAALGDLVCLDIEVKNFIDVATMQFGISWDTAGLSFENVNTKGVLNLGISNFGINNTNNGVLTFSWFDAIDFDGETLPDTTAIFELCFRVKETTDLGFAYVGFDPRVTPDEILVFDGNDYVEVPTDFNSGGVIIDNGETEQLILNGEVFGASFCDQLSAGINLFVSNGAAPYQYEWSGPDGFLSTDKDIRNISFGAYSVIVTDTTGLTAQASFLFTATNVVEETADLIDVIELTSADCSGEFGGAVIKLNRPEFTHQVLWSTGDTTLEVNELQAGTYEVTVGLGENCKETESVMIQTSGRLDFKQTIEGFSDCSDTTAILGIVPTYEGNFRYDWSTGDTTSSLTVTQPGTYGLTLTDTELSCPGTFVFEVEPAPDTFAIELPLIVDGFDDCADTIGAIRIDADSTLLEDFNLFWSTGATTSSTSIDNPGVYSLEITQKGTTCSQLQTVMVPNNDQEEDFGIIAEINRLGTCEDLSASIVLNYPDERDLIFEWLLGDTTDTVVVNQPGLFEVRVSEVGTRCTQNLSFTVPNSLFTADLEISSVVTPFDNCDGDTASIQLIVPDNVNYRYNWSTGDTTMSIQVVESGLYDVTITDLATGCMNIQSFSLFKPTFEEASLEMSCLTGGYCDTTGLVEVKVTVADASTAPYFFEWSTGEIGGDLESSTIQLAPNESFSVTVVNILGCAQIISDITPNCPVLGPDDPIRVRTYFDCNTTIDNREETFLYAEVLNGASTPPYIFEWSTGEVDTSYFLSKIIYDANVASYGITVTDATGKQEVGLGITNSAIYGCGTPDSSVVVEAPQVVVAPGEKFVYPVRVISNRQVERLILTEDWDDCLLRLDSIIDYSRLDEPPYVFEGLGLGTYELGFGTIGGDFTYPDTFTVQEFYFTVVGEEGVSPFLFSINEPPVYEGGAPAFVRPQHGSITVVRDTVNELVTGGDANNNGIINHLDLFNIGLFFGETGPDRRLKLTNLQKEFAPPWLNNAANGLNLKHADCDGNGQINAADVSVISNNWNGPLSSELNLGKVDSDLTLRLEGDSLKRGASNIVNIQLDNGGTATDIYGLAFTIVYDPQLLDGGALELIMGESILLENGDTPLVISRDFPLENKFIVAMVKTDGLDVNADGPIAQLQFQLLETATGMANFSIEAINYITTSEEILTGTNAQSSLPVETGVVNINTLLNNNRVLLFPNPVNNRLYIGTENLTVDRLEIFDLRGNFVKSNFGVREMNVEEVTAGLYVLKVWTSEGIVVKRWVKK